jgi:prepilin-type N-terminal cleavage/methylation domain-containing protein
MRRASGFTILELLVVIAIIGILIGLLIPAVQTVREAARRSQCANNLKQIGLAVHGYHQAHSEFPPGNSTKTLGVCPGQSGGNLASSEDRANWLILILPYLELKELYEAYNMSRPNESPENRTVRETRVGAYVCPSDIATDALAVPAMGPAAAWALNIAYMPGSYRAVAGRSNGLIFLDNGDFNHFPPKWRGPIHTVGIQGFNAERTADIRDGLSCTLMAGESTTCSNFGYRTFWAYSFSFYSLSSGTPQARTLLGDYDRAKAQSGTGGSLPCRRGWGSYHGRGMNFAVCDGSVRFLHSDIDPDLFSDLTTIDGRENGSIPD